MTTMSNFRSVGLTLIACLLLASSANAQLYGDVNDVNGQNNIGIGLSNPQFGLHMKLTDMVLWNYYNQEVFKVTTTGQLSAKQLQVTTTNGQTLFRANNDGIIVRDATGQNQFKVDMTGMVRARQVDVNTGPIPDYVFAKDYDLMPLSDLSGYIQQYKHLPKIKSAAEYEAIGSVNLGELQLQLLEKVEELTLYTLQQQREIDALKEANKALKAAISEK